MRLFKTFVLVLLTFLFVANAKGQNAKSICFNNRSCYTVVLPDAPTPGQVQAANQLCAYIGKYGVSQISNAKAYHGKHAIFLGRSPFTEKLYRQYENKIRDDGFFLHTDGNNLYIIGNQYDAVLNGVYHLLENQFGFMQPNRKSSIGRCLRTTTMAPAPVRIAGIWIRFMEVRRAQCSIL